jgi:hypothetical protein
MFDIRPLCPKCGTPARFVSVKAAVVSCELEIDGNLGKVSRVSRLEEKPYLYQDGTVKFRCKGGHGWKGKLPSLSSDKESV